MVKRILNCQTSDFQSFSKEDLLKSIKVAEGRTVCAEMVVVLPTVGGDLSNAEVARAFGADLMLLNFFDVLTPYIYGVGKGPEVIRILKHLVGRPLGCNLEPVDLSARMLEERQDISPGRLANPETFKAAQALGLDFICLTGNPGMGVSNEEIMEKIKLAKQNFDGIIMAGKMHGAGTDEAVIDIETVRDFIKSGADIIMVPGVGTIPGMNLEILTKIVKEARKAGVLVMSAIGTSQESSPKSVIERMALENKMAGVDIQHIGDAGYGGLALADNIFTLSATIRGLRHTIYRMASSVNR